jgi:hypothetical protein
VTDASPGVDPVYFNTSIGEFRGLKGIGNTDYLDQSCTESGTIYWYSTRANDSVGDANQKVYTPVYNWSCDIDEPIITNCEFNTSSIIYVNDVARLSCNVIDNGRAGVDSVIFTTRYDFEPENLGSEYYQDFTCVPINNGTYELTNVFANDTVSNSLNYNPSIGVFCDPFPPIIGNIVASQTNAPHYSTICLEVNITDPNNDSVWMEIESPSSSFNVSLTHNAIGCGSYSDENVTTYGYELYFEEQGFYTITQVFANDTGSQLNITNATGDVSLFSSDITPPDIISIWKQPSAKYYLGTGESVLLNAIVEDSGTSGVDTVLFEINYLNETTVNNSNTYYYNFYCGLNGNEANFTFTNVFANDTSGLMSSEAANLWVVCDGKDPVIIDSNTSLTAVEQYDSICLNVNVSDDYLDNVWVELSTGENITLSSNNPCSYGTHGALYQVMTDEDFYFNNSYANDSIGHLSIDNYEQLIEVVPSLWPSFKNCSLSSNELVNNENSTIYCEINDNKGIDTAWFEQENGIITNETLIPININDVNIAKVGFIPRASSFFHS